MMSVQEDFYSPHARRRAGRPYVTLSAIIEEETGVT